MSNYSFDYLSHCNENYDQMPPFRSGLLHFAKGLICSSAFSSSSFGSGFKGNDCVFAREYSLLSLAIIWTQLYACNLSTYTKRIEGREEASLLAPFQLKLGGSWYKLPNCNTELVENIINSKITLKYALFKTRSLLRSCVGVPPLDWRIFNKELNV